MSTFKKLFTFAAVLAIAVAGFVTSEHVSASDPTVIYTGQGFIVEGDDHVIKDERCGNAGEGTANDGGTGLFADWNGTGEPYEAGQPYLVWVLSLNTGKTAATVKLHLPDVEVDMIKVGGTYKYASQYYSYDSLVDFPVHATFTASGKNVQLVVSHGCAPFDDNGGAWCSPGFWKNARDGAWGRVSATKDNGFNGNVSTGFYGADLTPDATLIQVLTNPQTYSGSPVQGDAVECALNAYNATGAYLTNLLPGFGFSCAVMAAGGDQACPIDSHGNCKEGADCSEFE